MTDRRPPVSQEETMNKFFAPLFLCLAMALATIFAAIAPVKAKENTPKALEYIDAQVDVFEPMLEQYEADYFTANGGYFQALASHSSPPEEDMPPDGIYNHPTDQALALAELWTYAGLPNSVNWSFRVDVYNAPSGPGYVLVIGCKHGNDNWERSINHGPEDYRTTDWHTTVTYEE
jgi:hypothetical protein